MFENVLITGANGLLGRAVVKEMQGRARVTGFDLKAGDAPISWETGNLTDAAAIARALKGKDAILQIAAIPNIWSGGGEKIMQVNVVGLYLLLEAAEAALQPPHAPDPGALLRPPPSSAPTTDTAESRAAG